MKPNERNTLLLRNRVVQDILIAVVVEQKGFSDSTAFVVRMIVRIAALKA